MKKIQDCNHTVGYSQREAYDCWETDFVSLLEVSIENGKKLKSSDGCLYSFCPHCGFNLSGLVDSKVEELVSLKNKQEAEEKLKNEKRKEEFEKQVIIEAQKTGLEKLPEGKFIVLLNPTKNSNGKNVVIAGTKDHILRNCVHFNQNKSVKEDLIVSVIYEVPSKEFISSVMIANGWDMVYCDKTVFEKKVGSYNHIVDYSDESGTVYANRVGEDGYKTYDNFSINRLNDYLEIVKVDLVKGLELKKVEL